MDHIIANESRWFVDFVSCVRMGDKDMDRRWQTQSKSFKYCKAGVSVGAARESQKLPVFVSIHTLLKLALVPAVLSDLPDFRMRPTS